MKFKKDKGSLEYILCFIAIAIVCLVTLAMINVKAYEMRKVQVENFVTDSTLSGAIINVPKFELTGRITNYDINKTYNNFITCLKSNLKLSGETKTDGIITGFKGHKDDLVIANDDNSVVITDFYLYNAEFEDDDDDPGTFNVTKLIENKQVVKNPQTVIFAENADYATITLSKSTGKNNIVKLDKNTASVYVRLEIKLKPFSLFYWDTSYFTKPAIGVHEYLVDVARNEIYYVKEDK